MEGIKGYLLSVTAASLICGIINSLTGKKGTIATVTRLLTGMFLALTVIRPLVDISITDLGHYLGEINIDAEAAAVQGENLAGAELAAIIKSKTEAYILDKAALLGVDLEVEVILSDSVPPLPVGVILTGAVSPYARTRLCTFLEEEFGIPKEAQQWTG